MIDAMKCGISALLGLGLATGASAVPVTFQVNLRVQTELGRFNPATDTVEARGSFNVDGGGAWLGGFTLTNHPADTNLYLGTYDITAIAPGNTVAHKFVLSTATNGLIWEGNVGVGQADRTFTLADTDQMLPVVYFDNLTNNPGAGIRVTFQVNLGVHIARGAFDPTTGIVELRGPFFNNWGPGLLMTNLPGTSIYVTAFRIATIAPGSSVPYKYAINNGSIWDGNPNREFILANADQALPVDYFDRMDNLGPLSVNTGPFEIIVSWMAGPGIRLQSATNLNTLVWQDVPNTLGASSFIFDPLVEFNNGTAFFRLVGP
jgi:hypothetical protein